MGGEEVFGKGRSRESDRFDLVTLRHKFVSLFISTVIHVRHYRTLGPWRFRTPVSPFKLPPAIRRRMLHSTLHSSSLEAPPLFETVSSVKGIFQLQGIDKDPGAGIWRFT